MRRFWWIAFLALDVLILCLFIAGYVARWVDPRSFWWPQICAIALPLCSGFILFATPVYGVSKRWLMFALHAVCVILIAVRFVAFDDRESMPADESNTLRVASYNLGHFEIFSQAEQAKKLGEVLGLLYPDVLGLQEFMVRYRGEELRIRNLPYVANKLDSLGYQMVASSVHDVPTTFKPTWTRRDKLHQLEKQRVKIAQAGFEEMSFTRMKFNWRGRDAVHYNVHLSTFGTKKPWLDDSMSPLNPRFWFFYLRQYRDAFRYRAWQAEKVREMIEGESVPVILSGDFNSTPHNWAYAHLAERLQDVHVAAGMTWRTSFHVKLPLAKIDHILVTPDWKVYQAHIPPLDYSDHRPLVAVLGWDD